MGHARSDVKVDTQSAYLGTVNPSDLVKNIGLMSISVAAGMVEHRTGSLDQSVARSQEVKVGERMLDCTVRRRLHLRGRKILVTKLPILCC